MSQSIFRVEKSNFSCQVKINEWRSSDILAYLTIYLNDGKKLNVSKFVEFCFKKWKTNINGTNFLKISSKEWEKIFFVNQSITEFEQSNPGFVFPTRGKRIELGNFVKNQCQFLQSTIS